jgi:predicted nucleotidyltransferase
MGSSRRTSPDPGRTNIADALFTKAQQRVLGLLFVNSARSFYASEVIARANIGSGAVQRELARLEQSGLVVTKRIGNQKHYQANVDAHVFAELRALLLKTSGLTDILRAALAPLHGQIAAAFVYGSIARGSDTASSDVDVMVVSDTLSYGELFGALEDAGKQLGRVVNPTVYSHKEWHRRLREGAPFVRRVLASPKLWLIGDLPT